MWSRLGKNQAISRSWAPAYLVLSEHSRQLRITTVILQQGLDQGGLWLGVMEYSSKCGVLTVVKHSLGPPDVASRGPPAPSCHCRTLAGPGHQNKVINIYPEQKKPG